MIPAAPSPVTKALIASGEVKSPAFHPAMIRPMLAISPTAETICMTFCIVRLSMVLSIFPFLPFLLSG